MHGDDRRHLRDDVGVERGHVDDIVPACSGAGEDGALYVTSCSCAFGKDYDPYTQSEGILWMIVEAGSVPADATTAPLDTPEAATSPIFEAIQAVALRTFDDPKLDDVPSRRLVLVSDLMQNVPGSLSMYQGVPKFDDVARTPYWLDVKAELERVDVTVLYLQRPTSQRLWQSQIEFWSRYFEAQGASIARVLPLSGAQ